MQHGLKTEYHSEALTVGLVINKDGKRAAGFSTDVSYG